MEAEVEPDELSEKAPINVDTDRISRTLSREFRDVSSERFWNDS